MSKLDVANFVVGTISAGAAIAAAWFAGRGPSREDFERVEKNAANTAERLEDVHAHMASIDKRQHQQHEYESFTAQAQTVSIAASGRCPVGEPLPLLLVLKDPGITATRVELLNEEGNTFGNFRCMPVEFVTFSTTIDSVPMKRWYEGGTPVGTFNQRRLVLRVFMDMEERAVSRTMAVTLVQGTRVFANQQIREFILEGSV